MSVRRSGLVLLLVIALSASSPPLADDSATARASRDRVRPSALAGAWYPASPSLAASEVHRLLRRSRGAPAPGGRLRALIVPHAGWRYSGAAAASAFRLLGPGDFERVVVVAPAHRRRLEGFSVPDLDRYETPLGGVPLCAGAASSLRRLPSVGSVLSAHEREHAIEIELPFLQEALGSFCLVPILTGRTDAASQRELARALAALDDGRTLFVFSSDFTHHGPRYGYTPFRGTPSKVRESIRALDDRAVSLIERADAAAFREFLSETGATICGRAGISVLLELLPLLDPRPTPTRLASYASVDLHGAEGPDSVSYEAIAFTAKTKSKAKIELGPPAQPSRALDGPLSEQSTAALLRLARAVLETDVAGDRTIRAAYAALPDDPALDRLQGAFVTLNRTDPDRIARLGRLRGCIGQIFPTYPLHQAVVVAARSAALEDRRFAPVRAEELPALALEITRLSVPRDIGDWRDIRLGEHGIVLEKAGRRAVFLPQVPGEQGWDLEETLDHLARKAGLPRDGWRSGARFQVFRGRVLHESQSPETPPAGR